VSTKASPLEPAPDTSLDCILRAPEPVEMPTPVETLTSPPLPLLEELEPAEMSTAPPSPASEEPTSRERLPAVPLVAEPVDTTTGPEGPFLLEPVPMIVPR